MNKIFYLLFALVVACNFEMNKDLGKKLERNTFFKTNVYISNANATTQNTDFVEIIPGGQSYLLGVYKTYTHGALKTSLAVNIQAPSFYKYTTKKQEDDKEIIPTIDAVVLYIPYYYTQARNDKKGRKIFRLDSIYGRDKYEDIQQGGLSLNIYQLKTILHNTNQEGNQKSYPSNKTYAFDKSTVVGTLKNYTPKPSDTVAYIERRTIDLKKYKTDTVKLSNVVPRLAIRLNKKFFKEKILDKMVNNDGDEPDIFKNNENFKRYFGGLYVQANESTLANYLLSLKMTDAFITMYYTNSIVQKGTKKVQDKEDKKIKLSFSKLIVNKYEHDHKHSKDDKIYLQGAGGYQAGINLLGYDENNPKKISQELKNLREKANKKGSSWMITDANMRLYVDDISYLNRKDMKLKDTIYKLFMYIKTPDKNKPLEDNATYRYQGMLLKDKEKKQYFYEFKLTDYITELLEEDNDKNIGQFILRVQSPPDAKSNRDKRIYHRNWNPKNLVIYKGNSKDKSDERAIRFKINYSIDSSN